MNHSRRRTWISRRWAWVSPRRYPSRRRADLRLPPLHGCVPHCLSLRRTAPRGMRGRFGVGRLRAADQRGRAATGDGGDGGVAAAGGGHLRPRFSAAGGARSARRMTGMYRVVGVERAIATILAVRQVSGRWHGHHRAAQLAHYVTDLLWFRPYLRMAASGRKSCAPSASIRALPSITVSI